ncbi:IQ calmodulin-binding motif-containing protein 1-like isoform X2 [Limulus polyphemus]|uniref:IQ calmodulin-binding motif-containing protein 1-like isoform X2 n=1 Tax=Limulus polyphemus TaxID=6850 RepID=A0ABM1B2U4_LIMPO|nr:IQ calmodulin-binding motif-containing protein 1-like isoform X2 [Limulus polyphemus]
MRKKIKKVAIEISDVGINDIPEKLGSVNDILNEGILDSTEMNEACQAIWDYNIFSLIVSVIKQDFSKINGSWETAVKLISILKKIISVFQPEDKETDRAYKAQLTLTTDRILAAAGRYITTVKKEVSKDSTEYQVLSCMFKTLNVIAKVHPQGITVSLSSKRLLSLLMSNSDEVYTFSAKLLVSLLYYGKDFVSLVSTSTLQPLWDEAVYQIYTSENPSVVKWSIEVLSCALQTFALSAHHLTTNCSDLLEVLQKWQGKGFDHKLQKLQHHLHKCLDDSQAIENEKRHKAATKIQAVYRGYRIRKQLKLANYNLARLQRHYRLKKSNEQEQQLQNWRKEEQKFDSKIERARRLRLYHEKCFQAINSLPSGEVDNYLQLLQQEAAIKIQRAWRHFLCHREMKKMNIFKNRESAAQKIQRQVRKWLKERRTHKEQPRLQTSQLQPSAFPDVSELEEQAVIWKMKHPNLPELKM